MSRFALRIDPERLLSDLHALRTFGACGTGVVRTSFSKPDQASREWLVRKFGDAGLQAGIDGVGNVLGRSPADRALLLGSHSDTQREGGWLDGAMGVIYALEAARAWQEAGGHPSAGIDVASWMDEEGTYLNFLGSRSFCGRIADAEIAAAHDTEGHALVDAIAAAGYAGRPVLHLDTTRHLAYLEAHIEQGGVLESEDKRIGVVTAIIGAREYLLEFEGEQNHAGTTPMRLRKDAAATMFAHAAAIDARFREVAEDETVWTMGRVEIRPNRPSIVPGWAEFNIQFRDTRPDVLERMSRAFHETVAATGVPMGMPLPRVRETISVEPVAMDATLQSAFVAAAEHHAPGQWRSMPSGAGHDAQIFDGLIPSGMLFVPSIGGVSHSFLEDTSEADLVLGCQVFADAIASILDSPSLTADRHRTTTREEPR